MFNSGFAESNTRTLGVPLNQDEDDLISDVDTDVYSQNFEDSDEEDEEYMKARMRLSRALEEEKQVFATARATAAFAWRLAGVRRRLDCPPRAQRLPGRRHRYWYVCDAERWRV